MSKQRSIFEEVGDAKPSAPTSQGGMIDKGRGGARRVIRIWLGLLFVLVFVMIAVGGLTRLTDSGLSITEWKPVTGAMPPMSAADWQDEFEKYQQIPEFQLQNSDMTVETFKSIYWWEWGHRQLGRVIGLVWFVGFMAFLLLRKIPAGWTGRLVIPGVLGGIQGAIGWWMVHSGLSGNMLDVASYRLAAHLGLAFVILGLLAWYMMQLARPERDLLQARRQREARLFSLATGWMHLAFLQILLGALVAGIDAGGYYPEWPLMAGAFLPPDMFSMTPFWRNFFENPGTVQFIHRIVAYVLLAYSIMALLRGRRSAHAGTRGAFLAAFIAVLVQVGIGIFTVLHLVAPEPQPIAIIHQIMAVIVWYAIIRARFCAQYPVVQSVRGR